MLTANASLDGINSLGMVFIYTFLVKLFQIYNEFTRIFSISALIDRLNGFILYKDLQSIDCHVHAKYLLSHHNEIFQFLTFKTFTTSFEWSSF